MPRNLDDLERLLTEHGYACKRALDICVAIEMPTQTYTNAAGNRSIIVRITVDEEHGCLTFDTPWAFDARRAAHREATLACLLSAAGRSPFVKTVFDPENGEVRMRIDCPLGGGRPQADEVLALLARIPAFADRWAPHVRDAMEQGRFDATGPQRTAEDEKLESIARRGGGVNRIEALLRLRGRGGQDGRDRPQAGDPQAN